jgi:hypothetical protein
LFGLSGGQLHQIGYKIKMQVNVSRAFSKVIKMERFLCKSR